MPILVKCPSCPAKLNAPDASAGKRVKCPKCGATIPVPEPESDFEVVDDEPAPRPAKPVVARKLAHDEDERPRAKSRRRDEEDDNDHPRKRKRDEDEEEDDDRPRKKGADKKKGGFPIVLVAAIGGGVALLAIVGTVLFLVFGGKPTGPGGILGSSAPTGYTAVREPAGGFAVFLPGMTSKVDVKINDQPGAALGHYGWAGIGGGGFDPNDQQVWTWSRPIPSGFNPGTDPDGMLKLLAVYEHHVQSANQQYELVSKKGMTLGGKPGAEIRVKQKPHLMSQPGDNGFFTERDREESERVARDGEYHVFYVTHNGKQVFIVHVSQRKAFPADDMLKVIADSFTLI